MLVTASGKPLEPYEQAGVYRRLISYGWKEKDIATRTGKSVTHVNSMLKFNELDTETKNLVKTGEVSASLVVETVRKSGIEGAQKIIKDIIKKKTETKATTPVKRKDLGLDKKVSTEKLLLLAEDMKMKGSPTFFNAINHIKLYMDGKISLEECSLNLLENKMF